MENQASQIESLFERINTYLETRLDLFKLKIVSKISDLVSEFVIKLILVFFITLFLLFLNIGIALFLGDLLGKNYYGFFVLAAVYGLAGLIFYYARKKFIKNPLSNAIIKKLCE